MGIVVAHRSVYASVMMVVSMLLALPLAANQPRTTPADGSIRLRTPWGDPSFQGVWTNATITPLERPPALADKPFLTEEEVADLEHRAEQDLFIERAPQPGDVGTYNRVWGDRGTRVAGGRTSLVVDPPDGRIPYTPDARKAQELTDAAYGMGSFNNHLEIDTGERCLTDGLPFVPYFYNNNYQILQTPQHVAILHEMYQEVRIIPLDGRPHVGPNVGQWLGDARGHWDGDTLVIETTNFDDKTHYRWAEDWRASRPTLHLVERFTRVDEETIDYQFTVTDPTMFTRPWTAAAPLWANRAAGATIGQLYEYACHEGNYAMVNVLSGARAQEKAAAEGPSTETSLK